MARTAETKKIANEIADQLMRTWDGAGEYEISYGGVRLWAPDEIINRHDAYMMAVDVVEDSYPIVADDGSCLTDGRPNASTWKLSRVRPEGFHLTRWSL